MVNRKRAEQQRMNNADIPGHPAVQQALPVEEVQQEQQASSRCR
jgi:hypothetical protein